MKAIGIARAAWTMAALIVTLVPTQATRAQADGAAVAREGRSRVNFNADWRFRLGKNDGAEKGGTGRFRLRSMSGCRTSFSMPYFRAAAFYTGTDGIVKPSPCRPCPSRQAPVVGVRGRFSGCAHLCERCRGRASSRRLYGLSGRYHPCSAPGTQPGRRACQQRLGCDPCAACWGTCVQWRPVPRRLARRLGCGACCPGRAAG